MSKDIFTMTCKDCGNQEDFTMYSKIADFNSKKNAWEKAEGQEYMSDDVIVCDECGSTNIVNKTWDERGAF